VWIVPVRKVSVLVIFILSTATVISCVTLCRSRCERGPQFVGYSGPEAEKSAVRGLVIVTHGWIEKGPDSWPEDMVRQINKRVDANSWLCAYFDWSAGAKTFNPTDAAEYARDVAGPELAEEVISIKADWRHIHLIGHSSGCWAISEAAKILTHKTKADVHLTFLDAYVPHSWQESALGNVDTASDVNCWAEHYYTRDLTLGWTQRNLSFAHNVDITSIDGVLRDHNFPWQWYYATVCRKYPQGEAIPVATAGDVEYGFVRSREADDPKNWRRSLRLPIGNKAVRLKRQ